MFFREITLDFCLKISRGVMGAMVVRGSSGFG